MCLSLVRSGLPPPSMPVKHPVDCGRRDGTSQFFLQGPKDGWNNKNAPFFSFIEKGRKERRLFFPAPVRVTAPSPLFPGKGTFPRESAERRNGLPGLSS